jgi:hypothetical protein
MGDTFDGSLTWPIDRPSEPGESPLLRLHFTHLRTCSGGETDDLLTIADASDRTVVYKNDEPDTCPSFRLDLNKQP